MKDAAWRRYASGRCLATFDPKLSEWGNLTSEELVIPTYVGKRTRGSETSQYPEEKRKIFIS